MKLRNYFWFITKGIAILGVAIFLLYPLKTFAHSGNTASDGCHYCWTNCEYYGYVYGTRHCHYTYSAPVYNPPEYQAPSWSCKINNQTYYSSSLAKAKWQELVHSAVDDTYKKLLERSTNQNDYNYWESKIPYNNCNFNVDPQTMWNEVKISDEYFALQEKKYHTPTPILNTSPSLTKTTIPIYDPIITIKDYFTPEQWVGIFTFTGVIICLVILAIRIYIRKN